LFASFRHSLSPTKDFYYWIDQFEKIEKIVSVFPGNDFPETDELK
jgi:hypothetical protein